MALATCIGGIYLVWGVMISLQPPFYPKEAEAKGASPSQVRMAFYHVKLQLNFPDVNSMVLCLELSTWLPL